MLANPPSAAPEFAAAWAKYQADIEEIRQLIEGWSLLHKDPQVLAESFAILPQVQAQAWNMVIAPNTDYPRLMVHAYFEPGLFTWNLPCPDFVYRTALLAGDRRFRIVGRRNSASWVEIQMINAFNGVGANPVRPLGNFDLDDFVIAPDGGFEIVVGGEETRPNHLPTDPAAEGNWLLVRQLVYPGEAAPDMWLEPIDDDERRPPMDQMSEAELARRVARAGDMVKHVVMTMTSARLRDVVLPAVGLNAFHTVVGKVEKEARDGTNPIAAYQIAVYEIEPDEALVIETEAPPARYWGVHLGSLLNQTRDYIHHQSSLNDRSARPDADGKVRVVLSLVDPGVANWLDTVGTRQGRVVWRWYATAEPPQPIIRRVKLADLDAVLPPDTARVTPEERRRQLKANARWRLSHYGY